MNIFDDGEILLPDELSQDATQDDIRLAVNALSDTFRDMATREVLAPTETNEQDDTLTLQVGRLQEAISDLEGRVESRGDDGGPRYLQQFHVNVNSTRTDCDDPYATDLTTKIPSYEGTSSTLSYAVKVIEAGYPTGNMLQFTFPNPDSPTAGPYILEVTDGATTVKPCTKITYEASNFVGTGVVDQGDGAAVVTYGLEAPTAQGYMIRAWDASEYWEQFPMGANSTVLTADSATGEPEWHDPAHPVLSAYHPDTASAAVARGSLIVGNSTPRWDRFAAGANSTVLTSNGTDLSWQTIPNAVAHDLLSATHPDTNADAVEEDDLITGSSAPDWQVLGAPNSTSVLVYDLSDSAGNRIKWIALSTNVCP